MLTLNCFGIPAPSTAGRLLTLSRALEALNADLICLQEVQANPYRRLLIQACSGYPYHAYAPFVHAPKGGLLTLSRHPISQSRFVLYTERGLWYTPALADWILHKGVLITQLQIGAQAVVVMNTHLTANYSGDWSPGNRFARHEWEQLRQLTALVNAQPADSLVLVAGDFNVPRGSWLADQFLNESGLIDPLMGDHRPTFRPMKGLPARYAAAIDYALYRPPREWTVTADSAIRFSEPQPLSGGRTGHLSDHNAIELSLSLTPTPAESNR